MSICARKIFPLTACIALIILLVGVATPIRADDTKACEELTKFLDHIVQLNSNKSAALRDWNVLAMTMTLEVAAAGGDTSSIADRSTEIGASIIDMDPSIVKVGIEAFRRFCPGPG